MSESEEPIRVSFDFDDKAYRTFNRSRKHTVSERFFLIPLRIALGVVGGVFVAVSAGFISILTKAFGPESLQQSIAEFDDWAPINADDVLLFLIFLLVSVGMIKLCRRVRRSWRFGHWAAPGEMKLTLHAGSLELAQPAFRVIAPIGEIHSIKMKSDHLIICFSRLWGTAVPRSAFATSDLFDEFVRRLGGFRGAEK